MRKLVGAAICLVGVGGLGLYAGSNNAKRIETHISEQAGALSATSIHGLKTEVGGRDITLLGIANDIAERDGMLANLNQISGRRLVIDETSVLPMQDPFLFQSEKSAAGVVYSGHIPTEAARTELGAEIGEAAVAGLELSAGVPDEDWVEVAGLSARTLDPLIRGQTEVRGQTITLTGLALNPAAAALAEAPLAVLPEGYDVAVELELLDDGKPFTLDITSNGRAATFNGGKLPASMGPDVLSSTFGSQISGTVTVAKIGADEEDWPRVAEKAVAALKGLRNGQLLIDDTLVALTGLVANPTQQAVIMASMSDLPRGYSFETSFELEDDGRPFVLTMDKDAEGGLSAEGKLPLAFTAQALEELVEQPVSGDIADARIGKFETKFMEAASAGATALMKLKSGRLEISDDVLTLTGLSALPEGAEQAEEALSSLPRGYEIDVDIDIEDDGLPMDLSIQKMPDGLIAQGKVPASLGGFDFGETVNRDDVKIARIGDKDTLFPTAVPAGLAALDAMEAGVLSLSEEGLTLNGAVLTPSEETKVRAALAALPDGFDRTLELDVLDDGLPFAVNMTQTGTGSAVLSGKVPASMANFDYAKVFGGDVDATAVQVSILETENANFADSVRAALDGFAQVVTGQLDVTETGVILSGEVESPLQRAALDAALAKLPADVSVAADLILRDDGTPPAFTVDYKPGETATVAGKLPKGTLPKDLAMALGVDEIEGDPKVSTLDESGGAAALKALSAVARWLAETETLTYRLDGGANSMELELAPGVDAELITDDILANGGEGLTVKARIAAFDIANGTERTNPASGAKEVFAGVAWVPLVVFEPELARCQTEVDGVLAAQTIKFVSGSARLDAASVRSINQIAAIALNCFGEDELGLEIGGHTDSTGDVDANFVLSQQRAAAVLRALVARGIPEQRAVAAGYGPSQPIADNTTEEGRAANRRTTVIWSSRQSEGDGN